MGLLDRFKRKKTSSLADEEYKRARMEEEVEYAKVRAKRDVREKYSPSRKKKKKSSFGGLGDAFGMIGQAGRNFESSNVVGGFGGGIDYGWPPKSSKKRRRKK